MDFVQAARNLLTMDDTDPKRLFEGEALLRRMYRYGLLEESQNKLDYVLALSPQDFLERRLQTQVCAEERAAAANWGWCVETDDGIVCRSSSWAWPNQFIMLACSSVSATSGLPAGWTCLNYVSKESAASDCSFPNRVGKQIVNVPSFLVRVDSQKHIDFALNSSFGSGGPGRVKRKNLKCVTSSL